LGRDNCREEEVIFVIARNKVKGNYKPGKVKGRKRRKNRKTNKGKMGTEADG
jgi:hypothetical protein